jgi:putative FmdB family regulatory protein
MPVYNYICEECGDHFEHWLSFQEADKQVLCPKCHSKTKKVLSAPSVVFRGAGFYVTDHRSKSAARNEG